MREEEAIELLGEIEIVGEVVGKQRPRATSFGGRVKVYTPKKSQNYEARVAMAWRENFKGDPTTKPVAVFIVACLPLVKCDYNSKGEPNKHGERKLLGKEKPMKKPDIDNIAKSILDGLNGVAFADDSQIVSLEVRKTYGTMAKATVRIYVYNQGE